jgi:L-ascorbate metabolism protein UlaG (beta-lactamase superfamily)
VTVDLSRLRAEAAFLHWVGHATFLMRAGGKVIATDPIWSTRIQGAIKRRAAPSVTLEEAPPIDVVTVSHSHFDHLDLPTLKRIGPGATYVVPRHVGELLHEAGLPNVIELDWWDETTIGDLTLTLVPAQHWSMRMPWDRNRRLWGGFVYSTPEGRAYHAGDTAYSPLVFKAIGQHFASRGGIDWAMLPIGAYEPGWFMRPQHMDPEDALRAFDDLGARTFVAMHWGTFKLTDEPLNEPPERLRALALTRGLDAARLWVASIGDTFALDRTLSSPR